MIMCSACMPVMAKYRKKKICVCCAMSGGSGFSLMPYAAGIDELRDIEVRAGNVVLLPLFVVLVVLEAEEGDAEDAW